MIFLSNAKRAYSALRSLCSEVLLWNNWTQKTNTEQDNPGSPIISVKKGGAADACIHFVFCAYINYMCALNTVLMAGVFH